ncbi:MAG: carboxypeptidase M32, partial [Thermoplasmata archaeon]|nr:carboxypeptidase M32 [Thermoplasmata archaeon]
EAIGYDDQPYDTLLDEFEPSLKTAQVKGLLSRLRDKLVPIVSRIIDSGIRPDISFLTCEFPVDGQKEFDHEVAKKLGFDFDRGRIDESMHPFTTGTLHDTRFTTNYKPDNMRFSLFATIHETGHALYGQGHLEEHYGTPMGQPVSMGIHESQSRMWENVVGRSLPFWEYYYPHLKERFPKQLEGRSLEEFYAAINDVHPSLIRVEADEATYNLHILLRFEMENALFGDGFDPKEAPQVWNEKMEKFLKLEVPDDAHGVLQDIHWSLGYFGYFPTYTLGNLYAVQFFEQAKKEIPELVSKIENGEFGVLLNWLRSNIHEKGRLYRADELVQGLTGKALDEEYFINYLKTKFGELYGF